MSVFVQKNVFIPGESIFIDVIMKNGTKKDVENVKIDIFRFFLYIFFFFYKFYYFFFFLNKRTVSIKAKGMKTSKTENFSRQVFGGCKGKTDVKYTAQIDVPKDLYPSSEFSLIKVYYDLRIDCDVKMAIDLSAKARVVIALLPDTPSFVVPFFDNYPGSKQNYWDNY